MMLTSDQIPIQSNKFYKQFALRNKNLSLGSELYLDHDSLEKHRHMKKSSSKEVLDLQQQGKLIPFVRTKSAMVPFRNSYMKVLQPQMPLKSTLNKKDFQEYCAIKRTSNSLYYSYELPFNDTTVYMFEHRRFPIYDFKYEGVRYRWVAYYKSSSLLPRNNYSLYILDPQQPSLTDETKDGEVDSSNPLISDDVKKNTKKSRRRSNNQLDPFVSTQKIGQLNIVDSVNISGWNMTAQFEIGLDHDVNTIYDLTPKDMVLFSLAMILKMGEDVEELNRSVVSSVS